MKVTLKQAKSLWEWAQVYWLYKHAFPRSEQKPFALIIKMAQQNKTDVWCVMDGCRFKGFATTINGQKAILLDYLAVSSSARGQGIGGKTLSLLLQKYDGKGLFGEIESAFDSGADQELRQRRRQFYLNAGLESFGVMANVFGVKMELLGSGLHLTFAEYQEFYRENYSPWAAEHLSEVPYPDGI